MDQEQDQPIPGVPTDRTLSGVLERLREDGDTGDMFVTEEAKVRCGACHVDAEPASLQLNMIRRIEGASDPADEAAVLALTCPSCGAQGTAIVRYGPEAGPQDDEVLRAVDDLRRP
jgi:hypothetical protein